jgi:DNA-binding CsgD family transcriptional regulator
MKFNLTDQEKAVLLLIAYGETDAAIAMRVRLKGIIEVSEIMSSICKKMKVVNRPQATAKAVSCGIFTRRELLPLSDLEPPRPGDVRLLRMAAEGKTDAQIAEASDYAIDTVVIYLNRVARALGASSRQEAIEIARTESRIPRK